MKIETSDIYKALRLLLEKNFNNIDVQIKDKKNPKPPCFYVQYVDNTNTQTAAEYTNDSYVFAIIYFSQKETLQDLFFIEKNLKKILKNPLGIELIADDKTKKIQYQEIDSISINLNEDDYILNCTINISLDQLNTSDNLGITDFENRYNEFENDDLLEELEIEI